MSSKWLALAAYSFFVNGTAHAIDKMQMPNTELKANVVISLHDQVHTAFTIPLYSSENSTIKEFGKTYDVRLSAEWTADPDEKSDGLNIWITTDGNVLFVYESDLCGQLRLEVPLKDDQKTLVQTGVGECDIELTVFQ